jgi:hypothetical protein
MADMIKAFHWMAVCAVLWPSMALAANAALGETVAFLAYCKTNNDGCVDKVAEVSFAMLLPNGAAGKAWCPTDEVNNVKVLTPIVVGWLAAHPEVQNRKTEDGIKFALTQLYSCKRGNAATKGRETAADFMIFCQAKPNQSKCMDDIVDVNLAFLLNEKMAAANNYCEPQNFDAVDHAPAVLQWLGAHTELQAAPKDRAIAQAWGALCPCRKK